MSILAPRRTRNAVGEAGSHCDSRSLYFQRFANPDLIEDRLKRWYDAGFGKPVIQKAIDRSGTLPGATLLRAQLQSRLLVNISGGVMENAGLCIDRFGLPYIPGSAVKGCARRAALVALHQWTGDTTKPEIPLTPACEPFGSRAQMLAAIAIVFGYVGSDWSTDKNKDPKSQKPTTWKSDFAWAVHGGQAILDQARGLLAESDAFAGTIGFLAALPDTDPGLELDVLTPHHTSYYSGVPGFQHAPGTENPVPHFFPAVSSQARDDHFVFPLLPLRGLRGSDLPPEFPSPLDCARAFLALGLELFGLGAKSNAGYGVFSHRPDLEERFDKEAEIQGERISMKPDAKSLAEFESLYAEEKLASLVNQFAFDDEKFWPRPPDPLGEDPARLALFRVMEKHPELAETKKGKKAFTILAQKFTPSS